MDKANINSEEMTKDLLVQWLDQKAFLDDKYKKALFQLGCDCINNVGVLYQINKAIIQKQESFGDENSEVALHIEGDLYKLKSNEEEMELTEQQLREIVAGMIDLLGKTLPLGTVVDLKKEFFTKSNIPDTVENIRIVITHRFLYREEDTSYFPYAGVVYPVGVFDKNEIIHFTPALIENVVHTGYSDPQEDVYVYMMKQELIVEKGMHSFGFSTLEERNRLQARIQGGGTGEE